MPWAAKTGDTLSFVVVPIPHHDEEESDLDLVAPVAGLHDIQGRIEIRARGEFLNGASIVCVASLENPQFYQDIIRGRGNRHDERFPLVFWFAVSGVD